MSCFHVVAVVRPFVFTVINQLMCFMLYYIELVTTIDLYSEIALYHLPQTFLIIAHHNETLLTEL